MTCHSRFLSLNLSLSLFVFSTSLLTGIIRWSRLTLSLSHLNPGISHLSEEPGSSLWGMVLETKIRVIDVLIATEVFCFLTLSVDESGEYMHEYKYRYIFIHIYKTCIFTHMHVCFRNHEFKLSHFNPMGFFLASPNPYLFFFSFSTLLSYN